MLFEIPRYFLDRSNVLTVLKEMSDADITVFDPVRVIDRATYEDSQRPSEGIEYVLVAGRVVVRDGELVRGVYPGEPILSSGPVDRRGRGSLNRCAEC